VDPFDTVDVTEDGEFISFKHGFPIPEEEVEYYFEAGICFTRRAEKVLLVNSGEYLKEQ
jgi:hypothetical protein